RRTTSWNSMPKSMEGAGVPDDFERMWAALAPIGRSASSGGYFRQPFTPAERELDAWFAEQALARGLRLERDGIGNVVAWWDAGPIVPDLSHPGSARTDAERQGLSRKG